MVAEKGRARNGYRQICGLSSDVPLDNSGDVLEIRLLLWSPKDGMSSVTAVAPDNHEQVEA